MYCPNCGKEINKYDKYCPHCGYQIPEFSYPSYSSSDKDDNVSDKSWLATLLFCLFLGTFGIHRFYVGKVGTGILYLLTFGVFGIGYLIDVILIVLQLFTDRKGRKITINSDF